MKHVFDNGMWCGSLSNRSIVTAMMTIHRPLVKKVYPRTTKNNTCMNGACKVAFSKGWAMQSPQQCNSQKRGPYVLAIEVVPIDLCKCGLISIWGRK